MKFLFEDKRNITNTWHEEYDDVYWSKSLSPEVVQTLCFKLMNGAEIYKIGADGNPHLVDFIGEFSIESVMYHLCGVVYPQSRWLSNYVAYLLHKSDLGKAQKEASVHEFIKIIDASACKKQKDYLTALVEKVLMDLDNSDVVEVEE